MNITPATTTSSSSSSSFKKITKMMIPDKYYVSQKMTKFNYKTDFVYRWLMYTTGMVSTYANYLKTHTWNCGDLDENQMLADMNFISRFPSIVAEFIHNNDMSSARYVNISEEKLRKIIFSGSNFHTIALLFYCTYNITTLQNIIKPACKDYDYFMDVCKEKFDNLNIHCLLQEEFPNDLVNLVISLAKDYMTKEKKKIPNMNTKIKKKKINKK